MNIAEQLPSPLNTFVVDIPAGRYYDFELRPDSTYPLPGVTYPVDYGHIPGYTAEDHHELDLFVGAALDGLCGSVAVDRGRDAPREHKFYVALTAEEVDSITRELAPVLLGHQAMAGAQELLAAIEPFKD